MPSIKALPAEVAAQVNSSTAIPSLTAALIGLLQNSLDAQASEINAAVDLVRASFMVEDDGVGILPESFAPNGGLGKAHHTSKHGSGKRCYGSNGTFLSSLAALSILTICSRHKLHSSTNTLMLHHSRPAARLIPAPNQCHIMTFASGTKVSVHDLFGNMPVRVHQRPVKDEDKQRVERDWNLICHEVAGLLLAWGQPVIVTLRSADGGKRMRIKPPMPFAKASSFSLDLVRQVLSQGLGLSPASWPLWVQTSARTSSMSIRAAICLEPAPSKRMQFISLSIHPVQPGSSLAVLYDEVNRLFSFSRFGQLQESMFPEKIARAAGEDSAEPSDQKAFAAGELRGAGKGTDRYPVFFIKIELSGRTTAGNMTYSNRNNPHMSTITSMLQALVTSFLTEHHFQPRNLTRSKPDGRSHSTSSPAKPRNDAQTGIERTNDRVSMIPSDLHSQHFSPLKRLNTELFSPRSLVAPSRVKCGISNGSSGNQAMGVRPRALEDEHSQTVHQSAEARLPSRPQTVSVTGSSTVENDRRIERSHTPNINDHSMANTEKTMDWTDSETCISLQINTRTGQAVLPLNTRPMNLNADSADDKPAVRWLSRQGSRPLSMPEEGSWAASLIKTWENPVFSQNEEPISRLEPDKAFFKRIDDAWRRRNCEPSATWHPSEDNAISTSSKLLRESLKLAKVISQVDGKFILVRVKRAGSGEEPSESLLSDLLVLIDQHAADERVRVESLFEDLCHENPNEQDLSTRTGIRSAVRTLRLGQPIRFKISALDADALDRAAPNFSCWGILYNIHRPLTEDASKVLPAERAVAIDVLSLPPAIAERCRINQPGLLELLRSEAWKHDEVGSLATAKTAFFTGKLKPWSWTKRIHACPQGILDMIASRACRSAIMFNDKLTIEECERIVAQLADCSFPFQCAHGRPSMIPLAALRDVEAAHGSVFLQPDRGEFGRESCVAWPQWVGGRDERGEQESSGAQE